MRCSATRNTPNFSGHWCAIRMRAGGLRKLRVAAQGKGKRGGARLIYFVVDPAQQCRMLLIYRKGVQDDLSEDQKAALRRMIENWT
ncbi:MAG TPA: hypothetical protein PKZ76_03715 [Xanthomonadaceae bacterium]|nr:hypothetical protein [Xanthomonadaceae bacterium]